VIIVVLTLSITSCDVQRKATVTDIVNGDERSFYWRLVIRLQSNKNDVNDILAVLEINPRPFPGAAT
jgi:hypothetical protein